MPRAEPVLANLAASPVAAAVDRCGSMPRGRPVEASAVRPTTAADPAQVMLSQVMPPQVPVFVFMVV
jgi:hypothetical protein